LLETDQQVRMARSDLRAAEDYAQEYGSPLMEVLTVDEARRLEPEITADAPAVVRCRVTAQVRNPCLLRALRLACVRAGVHIEEHRQVTSLMRDAGRVSGARTDSGDFQAGQTVLAAGAWSALLDEQVRHLAPVYPVRGQIVLLYRSPPPLRHILERGKCYVIPRRDGHILVGSTTEHDSGYDEHPTEQGARDLRNGAMSLAAVLKEGRVVRSWAGLRPGTPDGRPVIGTHEFCPGLIFATGHFKTGICLMWITARVVRDLVIDGRTEVDLQRCLPGRDFSPSKRPPKPKANPPGRS
jgi:glycine oxidase